MTNASESLSPEQEGMARVGAMLAMVVEDALRPALLPYRPSRYDSLRLTWVDQGDETGHDGYVLACEHVKLGTAGYRRDAPPVVVDRNAYLCPQHPERLLCDEGTCITDHYAEQHSDDPVPPLCFLCEQPVDGDEFVPVFGEITLHRNVNVGYNMKAAGPLEAGPLDLCMAYGGVLLTLPVAYLCGLHAGVVEVPIRMGWPMTFPTFEGKRSGGRLACACRGVAGVIE